MMSALRLGRNNMATVAANCRQATTVSQRR
jgi:hypothetical protein